MPNCISHTAKLTHVVTGQTGLRASSLFLLRCFFRCSRTTERVNAMGSSFLRWWGDDCSSTEGKAGGQQHDFPCPWAVLPRDKDSPDLKGQMVNGWVAQSALLLLFCQRLTIFGTFFSWFFVGVWGGFLLRGPCPYVSLSVYLKDKKSNFLHTMMERKQTKI